MRNESLTRKQHIGQTVSVCPVWRRNIEKLVYIERIESNRMVKIRIFFGTEMPSILDISVCLEFLKNPSV